MCDFPLSSLSKEKYLRITTLQTFTHSKAITLQLANVIKEYDEIGYITMEDDPIFF